MQLTSDNELFSVTFIVFSAELVCCFVNICLSSCGSVRLNVVFEMFVSFSVFLLMSARLSSQGASQLKLKYSSIKKSFSSSSKSRNQANHLALLLFLVHIKIQYKEDLGSGTALPETPEMERVKRNQQNISTVLHRVTLPSFISSSTRLPSIFPPQSITRPVLTHHLLRSQFSL